MKKTFLNTLTIEEIIKRLKDGEVIHNEEGIRTIKMIEGVIVGVFETATVFNYAFAVNHADDFYFKEEEPFEITEKGFYRTRDGRKAFVYEISDDTDDKYPISYILENDGTSHSATKRGKYATGETELDIVAKWEN